ncbi:MAG: PepSY domain-containing protein [Bacteroidota bacterium]
MSLSLWRVCHLWLAIVSGLFLLVAAITGLILSFEPVYERAHGYSVEDADNLSIAELVTNISSKYSDISAISRDHNGFIVVTAFDQNDEVSFYANPFTGQKLGEVIETPAIFEFSRTLHRSLFFGKTGRFIVGSNALFLLFISITGFFLTLRKQGSLTAYFKKVVKEEFYKDYHTKLGKLAIWLILVVSITGSYLFFVRFSIIPENKAEHEFDFDQLAEQPIIPTTEFQPFVDQSVSNLKEVIFPFSEFVEDFFELKLDEKDLLINQKTGETISAIRHPISQNLFDLSFRLHTGEGQVWWSLLLAVTSLSIVFFIYSGYTIYFKRLKDRSKVTNPYPQEECEWIVACGSELGRTMQRAQLFHQALLKANIRAFLTEMNEFENYPAMKKLIIFTSTYGSGDAPSNASNFIHRLDNISRQLPHFEFSVLGFGSRSYPDFCKYASDVQVALEKYENTSQMIPLHLVDNQSEKDFQDWLNTFERATDMNLEVESVVNSLKLVDLKVVKKKFSENNRDATFLLELSSSNGVLKNYQSGDLLVIRPEDNLDRYYSMSVVGNNKRVLLSIKKHPKGIVSNYLSSLSSNDTIKVGFKKNNDFHFPRNTGHILMIANGTGIGPFLGMLENNSKNTSVTLFWGGQNELSYQLYDAILKKLIEEGKLSNIKTAFSRVGNQSIYVQEILRQNEDLIINYLEQNGNIMICGSLKMQQEAEQILAGILETHTTKTISDLKIEGRILADCY